MRRRTQPAGTGALEANVRRFYVYRFLVNVQLWLPIWVLYLQHERGLTLAQVTALDAPFWLVNVLAQIPTGAFADRWGRKPALLVGCVILAGAYFVFGIGSSYPVLLASYMLWAVGLAFQQGADLALLYDNLAVLGRTEDYARCASFAFGLTAAAAVVGMLAGAELAHLTRLDVPIIVSAGLTLVSVVVVLGFHEPRRSEGAGARPSLLHTIRRAFSVAWRQPALRYLLGFAAALQTISLAPMLLAQPFLAHYNTPVGLYGVLQTPARLCSVLAAVYAYRVARRFGERRLLVALTVWTCGCLALIAAWHSVVAFVAFPLMALGLSSSNPVLSDILNRLIPPAERATVLSLLPFGAGILLIGFEPGLGAVAQGYGVPAGFAAALAILVVTAALTLGPWLATVRHGYRSDDWSAATEAQQPSV